MKSNPTALCGVSLSMAVAMYVVVRRARRYARLAAKESELKPGTKTTITTTTTTKADGSVVVTKKYVTTKITRAPNGELVKTVLIKDEAVEAERIESDQQFPDGSEVSIHGLGTAKVLQYLPESLSYKVEVSKDGKLQQKTVMSADISQVQVKDFYVYPIKSCRGIRLEHAQITPRGIANDRAWMIVDTKGKFITQRRYEKLALIVPELDDLVNPTALTLTAAGRGSLRVPIILEGEGTEVESKVWTSKVVAIDQGDAAAEWLNRFLADVRGDREFRLVRTKDSFKRPTNPKYAPGHQTVFADGYPFLLALESSLADVNSKVTDKVAMDQFRPNIVLTGAPAFADEHWSSFTIGGIIFRNVKPCDRCKMPTINQQTGVAHPQGEPQRTMMVYRNGVALEFEDGSEQAYYFGSNLVADGTGHIEVGAPVKVLTTKVAVFA